jgi:hypothetical protein
VERDHRDLELLSEAFAVSTRLEVFRPPSVAATSQSFAVKTIRP